jgi:hypothetical protein
MGKYSLPAQIRVMKPKGTMVKKIPSGYYVTRDGIRKTQMGPVSAR